MKRLRRRHGHAARRKYAVVTESLSGERTGSRGKRMSLAEATRAAKLYTQLKMRAGRPGVVRVLDEDGHEVVKVRVE